MNYSDNTPNNFVKNWTEHGQNRSDITHVHKIPASDGIFVDFPNDLHPGIKEALNKTGIHSLYLQQATSFDLVNKNENLLINSGTASGKTLAFFLPILNNFIQSNGFGNCLFLFPTKALCNDQFQKYNEILLNLDGAKIPTRLLPTISIYDGDTPKSKRAEIRKKVNFLLSNPDMLHYAILPFHTQWDDFYQNLKYVVFDEIHYYRGVFGSHVANVIRRLKRISNFYGRKLQFICTSATIGNPIDFVEKMIEESISIVNDNSTPRGEKVVIFFNPPLENQKLGLRKSAFEETIRISHDFSARNIQTLVFQISRRSVEKALKTFQSTYPDAKILVNAYRSGYLAQERRQIENQLRSGQLRLLFSTNALELGMDVGSINNVIMSGYPGSISSTLQQIGRAGRRSNLSSAILIANSSPIDQYLINHPEFVLLRSPESALIDPNNLLILANHLRCSASELQFEKGENFGGLEWNLIEPLLADIQKSGEIFVSKNTYFWVSSQSPTMDISLRNISGNIIKLIDESTNKIIGQVDFASSLWMVHEGAIYMQQGREYFVNQLDLSNNIAYLQEKSLNYYTNARREIEIEICEILNVNRKVNFDLSFGNIEVDDKVVGFDEILWDSNEKINSKELMLPSINLHTQAFWFSFNENLIEKLRTDDLWLNDKNNYGENWKSIQASIRKRDQFRCQVCGLLEVNKAHHVHHIKPLRLYRNPIEANQFSNLITLCPKCHKRVELNVKVRSGLSGLRYLAKNMAPLFLMCDYSDIEVHVDPASKLVQGMPFFLLYENIPYGIGLSRHVFEIFSTFFTNIYHQVLECPCESGCPSCVGPEMEFGYGGKNETIALIKAIID